MVKEEGEDGEMAMNDFSLKGRNEEEKRCGSSLLREPQSSSDTRAYRTDARTVHLQSRA